jgi:hypothetical protein
MVALAIGVAGLAAAAAFPDARLARRRNIANASAIPLVVGAMVLAGARIPSPDPPVQIAAQPLPMPIASPNVVAHDDHMMDHHAHATPTVSSATPEPLLGPGTTLSGDGISVTLAAAPQVSGPVTVSIKIGEAEGSPLAEARVAVISDMPDMAMGRMETPALETEPGLYVAEFVPLGMTGEWRLAVRVSPRGASTQVFAFAVQVP